MKNYLLIAALTILCIAGHCQTATSKIDSYSPAHTKIAILPIINKSADFDKNFDMKIKGQAQKALIEQFSKRGFDVIPDKAVEDCVSSMQLDLEARETWKAEVIRPAGEKLGADLVLFGVVLDGYCKTNYNFGFFGGTNEGFATVRVLLVDVKTGDVVLDQKGAEGKVSGSMFGGFEKGMDKQAQAVVRGFQVGLNKFFKEYPVHKDAGK